MNVHSLTPAGSIVVSVLALVIGGVSFTGSVLAYLKLEGTLRKQWVVPMHNVLNVLMLIAMAGIGVLMVMNGLGGGLLLALLVDISVGYGVVFVFIMCGADMRLERSVVIC